MQITITSYPRIHISLLDLTSKGHRLYGGIGFSFNGLSISFEITSTSKLDIDAFEGVGYSTKEIDAIRRQLTQISTKHGFNRSIALKSVSPHFRHSGLGTGTQVRMALTEALSHCNGRFDQETISRLAGRGGASGVGVHTYFDGGLVLDIGRPRRSEDAAFLPSNKSENPDERPLKLGHVSSIPWACGIFLPMDVPCIHADAEEAFFKTATPAPEADVYKAVYEAVFGVYGGAASSDFDAFTKGINNLQNLHWKKSEILLHRGLIDGYIKEIKELGAQAVGMSSFGPCIYFFGKNTEDLTGILRSKYPNSISLCTTVRLGGRAIYVR